MGSWWKVKQILSLFCNPAYRDLNVQQMIQLSTKVDSYVPWKQQKCPSNINRYNVNFLDCSMKKKLSLFCYLDYKDLTKQELIQPSINVNLHVPWKHERKVSTKILESHNIVCTFAPRDLTKQTMALLSTNVDLCVPWK